MSMVAPVRRPDLGPERHLVPVTPSTSIPGSISWLHGVRRTRARRRPKAFFALVTAVVMFCVMIAQMLLSVALESGAYEIAHLQSANKEASRSFQQMTQDIDRLSSPQHLALNAEALGMLSNNPPAYLRLSDGAILGAPSSGDGFTRLVGSDGGTLVPNSLLANVPLVTSASLPQTGDAASHAAPAVADPNGAPAGLAPAAPVALAHGLPGLATH